MAKLFVFCLLLESFLATEGVFRQRGYEVGAAGGGYVHVSGGSGGYIRGPGYRYVGPSRQGIGESYSSGRLHAQGGFVAGEGSVSAGYKKGYNRGNFIVFI